MYYYGIFNSHLGPMISSFSDTHLIELNWLPKVKVSDFTLNLIQNENHKLFIDLKLQLQEYFDHKRKVFSLPLDPKGTTFQKNAWSELLKIPYGETISYQKQAERLFCPKGYRAVGMANAKNPIPIIIPCHRVISKSGAISGYSGGMDLKIKLLELENFRL